MTIRVKRKKRNEENFQQNEKKLFYFDRDELN